MKVDAAVATRKKLTAADLRKKAFEQRALLYNLSEKYEETLIYERMTEQQKDDLNDMLQSYQKMYGSVQYHNWLRAVMRSMKKHFTDVGKVLVFPVLGNLPSDEQKRQYLEVIAQQMNVDVTVTLNRKKPTQT